ncbi:hypothetical protein O7599_29335 [Streptomyces sp. WMMC500]|uniref:DUF6879 family protein n=1 Tax=Streptomyces sp. WMMC500 TaxID=3015154 RepID=UPI00248AD08E|nr:DUF6879 family protein [Streptomyces sp. WMMC500]WBB59626.1 hypothetical protein O7599_29335 [Streptomyces sp. WMMC500]
MADYRDEFNAAQRSAVHLEMRDSYIRTDPGFIAWQGGRLDEALERYGEWRELMQQVTGRGVAVRRARIVSEPVSDYIRYEYDLTEPLNLAGGEEVRWLPRRRASDIALPGNDFWLFDDRIVRFNHFTGDGGSAGPEVVEEPAVVKLCSAAFETVWSRAIPHADYEV